MRTLLRSPISYCVIGGILAFLFEAVRADWWGAFILAGMISLYGFMAKNYAREEYDEMARTKFREIGDNCYFIGFIFTLVVIVATLILDSDKLIGNPELELPGQPQQLLKTIGIALATSVAGMLMRFYISGDLSTSKEALDEEIEKVAIAANRINSAAIDMSKEMDAFAHTLFDASQKIGDVPIALQQSFESINDSFKKLLSDFNDKINNTVQINLFSGVRTQLMEIVESHKAAVEEAQAMLATSMQSLDKMKDSTVDSSQQMQQAVAELTETLNKLNKSLSDYAQEQKAAAENAALIAEKSEEQLQLAAQAKEKYSKLSSEAVSLLYTSLKEGAESQLNEIKGDSAQKQNKGKQK